MKDIDNLIADLTSLNDSYNKITNRRTISPPNESKEEYQGKLISSAQLIIDFYNDVFKPKYSKLSGDKFNHTSKVLSDLSSSAIRNIEGKRYFTLGFLQTPWGTKKSDPTILERLIEKIKD